MFFSVSFVYSSRVNFALQSSRRPVQVRGMRVVRMRSSRAFVKGADFRQVRVLYDANTGGLFFFSWILVCCITLLAFVEPASLFAPIRARLCSTNHSYLPALSCQQYVISVWSLCAVALLTWKQRAIERSVLEEVKRRQE